MRAYTHDFRDQLHQAPNHVRWYDWGSGTSNTGKLLSPDWAGSYFGIAYQPYGSEKEVYRCPSKKVNNHWWNEQQPWHKVAYDYSDYAINGYLVRNIPRRADMMLDTTEPGKERGILRFKSPSTTIVLHDHFETMMEGDDAFFIRYGDSVNLSQWRRRVVQNVQEADALHEIWRHGGYNGEGRGSANILWLDGHISNLKETTGEDVPFEWYSGGLLRQRR
jgi:prepilin-type processing-associated H-X9-DG protein